MDWLWNLAAAGICGAAIAYWGFSQGFKAGLREVQRIVQIAQEQTKPARTQVEPEVKAEAL